MAIVSRIASFVTLLFAACSVAFPAAYTVRVLGASGTPSTAAGINQTGDVAGQSGIDAWVWHAGTMRFIEDPLLGTIGYRAKEWLPLGVDSAGNLEAYSQDIDSVVETLRFDAVGLHPFDSRPLGFVSQQLHPTASGPGGQIVGWYLSPGSGPTVTAGFVSSSSSLASISPPGWAALFPRAVNASGWIAGDGQHNGAAAGFLLRNGSMNDLGHFLPLLLNDRGNMAGKRLPDGSLFVWIGNASFTIAPLAGHAALTPLGMNNLGAVVGIARGTNPADTVGFLWTPATGTQSMESAAEPDVDLRILAAHGINDAGQIAADAAGITVGSPHAVLLTPAGRFTP